MYLGDAKAQGEMLLEEIKKTMKPASAEGDKVEMAEIDVAVEEEEEELPEAVKWLGCPSEVFKGETRIAVTPNTARVFRKKGWGVYVQAGAGLPANFHDVEYTAAGATVLPTAAEVWDKSSVILKVRPPTDDGDGDECRFLDETKTILSFVWPAQNEELIKRLTATKAAVFAMDMVPRISRSQCMDALSSMTKTAGYRAIVEASNYFGKFFSAEITAAGDTPPATVLVIGAGIAGMSAVSVAKKMGCVVRAFDSRPAARAEVETLGAEFLEVKIEEDGTGVGGYAKTMSPEFIAAEMELFRQQAKTVDIVVTTALIPGRKAPILWKYEALDNMKSGSVVVDLAAEAGGNCDATKHGEVVNYKGVHVIGHGVGDLVAAMPAQASQMYSTNLVHCLTEFGNTENWNVDFDSVIIRNMCIANNGEAMYPPPKLTLAQPTAKKEEAIAPIPNLKKEEKSGSSGYMAGVVGVILLVLAAIFAPTSFIAQLFVFVLSCYVGWAVINNVQASLHTPLMSVSNAISGIVILGGITQVIDNNLDGTVSILSLIAVCVASINVGGGFLVTQRLLNKFVAA
eukprot:TRINITY_DN2424_c0_g1_i1.p1 TRINITY_DN2424_c0_g1~~TRINITY_DN2424_c0_g1_i1.p1  ORF type:complete len:570 (+),score=231.53 TRINITY_DN2424_c0_g1_i1:126-1835(+)